MNPNCKHEYTDESVIEKKGKQYRTCEYCGDMEQEEWK
jgi:hypothetical protein